MTLTGVKVRGGEMIVRAKESPYRVPELPGFYTADDTETEKYLRAQIDAENAAILEEDRLAETGRGIRPSQGFKPKVKSQIARVPCECPKCGRLSSNEAIQQALHYSRCPSKDSP